MPEFTSYSSKFGTIHSLAETIHLVSVLVSVFTSRILMNHAVNSFTSFPNSVSARTDSFTDSCQLVASAF
jgi:hypothetical protein